MQIGARWPTPTGRAPQLVMAPEMGLYSYDEYAKWVDDHFDHFIDECGFDGFHVPLQGHLAEEGLVHLLDRCDVRGKVVIPWLAGDEQGGTVPDDIHDHTRLLIPTLSSHPSWITLGLGYDTFEWYIENETAEWISLCKSLDASRLYGARAGNGGGNHKVGHKRPGSYASYEWHIRDGAVGWRQQLADAVRDADGLPILWAERGRVRGTYDKDPELHEIPDLISGCLEYNVGGIWGRQDDRGSVSGYGSGRWENVSDLRAVLVDGVTPPNLPNPTPPASIPEGDIVPVIAEDMRQYTIHPGEGFDVPGADHVFYNAVEWINPELGRTGDDPGVAIIVDPAGEHREVIGGVHIHAPVGTTLLARHAAMTFHGYVNYGRHPPLARLMDV